MKAMPLVPFFALMIAAALPAGCQGYRHGFDMPAGAGDVHTVAIDIFKNKTIYDDLENEFAIELQKAVSARTRLDVADHGEADSLITGAMETYRRAVLREFESDDVARYAIVIGVSYRFIRLPSDGQAEKVIASNDNLRWSTEYEVLSSDTEADARARALHDLAREVVNDIFEPWKTEEAPLVTTTTDE